MEKLNLGSPVKGKIIGDNEFHIIYEDETQKTHHIFMFQNTNNNGKTELDAISLLPEIPESETDLQLQLNKNEVASIKDLLDFELKMKILLESDAKKILSNKFILTNEIGEMFNNVIRGRKNAMIWGPPGHGKSEMSEEIFKQAGLTEERHFYLKSMSIDTSVEELYGGFDLAALKERNEQFFNFENSFMNRRIVIIEEILDAPAVTLQAFKDILTRKRFANGKQNRPIKTQIVIGLTNHNPSDLAAKGESQKAICERFLYNHKLQWEKYDYTNYNNLLRKRYQNSCSISRERFDILLKLMLSIIQSNLDEGKNTSPRTAINAFGAILDAAKYEKDDFQCVSSLKFIQEFSEEMRDMMSSHMTNIKERIESKERLENFTKKVNSVKNSYKTIDFSTRKYSEINANLRNILYDAEQVNKYSTASDISFNDDDYKEFRIQCNEITQLIHVIKEKMKEVDADWFEYLKNNEMK